MALVIFQDLAAPALGESESEDAVTAQRRAVEAKGRAHAVGARVVPRPSANLSGKLVSRGLGFLGAGGHGGVMPFEGVLAHRCTMRKPKFSP